MYLPVETIAHQQREICRGSQDYGPEYDVKFRKNIS